MEEVRRDTEKAEASSKDEELIGFAKFAEDILLEFLRWLVRFVRSSATVKELTRGKDSLTGAFSLPAILIDGRLDHFRFGGWFAL
jgi:hypothetical protein